MNILIPMAGEGKRSREEGYQIHKPAIPVTDWRTGEKVPMVICAVKDLPGVCEEGENLIYVDRDFHKTDGVEKTILSYYPRARFITTEKLTEGQACTCLLAKEWIEGEEELLIAGCDNGMVLVPDSFEEAKQDSDCVVFVYRHNPSVCLKPEAYGWVIADNEGSVKRVSIKKAISEHPMEDYAVVATFWFRRGQIFIEAAQEMIKENDRINNEFYVDKTMEYVLRAGGRVKILEVDRYIGWGTPADYEEYEHAFDYWKHFTEDARFLGTRS